MIPITAGDRVEPGVYRLIAKFSSAAYYSCEDRLVCVASEEAGAGPFYITVRGFNPARCGPVLVVRDDHFILGGRRIERSGIPVYDSKFDAEPESPEVVQSGLRAMRAKLLDAAPPESLVFLLEEEETQPASTAAGGGGTAGIDGTVGIDGTAGTDGTAGIDGTADRAGTAGIDGTVGIDGTADRAGTGFEEALRTRFFEGTETLFSGDVESGARLLGGCGRGLTPSGDDFLAGVAFGLRLAGKLYGVDMTRVINRIIDSAEAGGPVSEYFLRMAREERPTEHLRDVLAALCKGDDARLEPAVSRLLEHGATSGADTATGLLLAIERGRSLWSRKD